MIEVQVIHRQWPARLVRENESGWRKMEKSRYEHTFFTNCYECNFVSLWVTNVLAIGYTSPLHILALKCKFDSTLWLLWHDVSLNLNVWLVLIASVFKKEVLEQRPTRITHTFIANIITFEYSLTMRRICHFAPVRWKSHDDGRLNHRKRLEFCCPWNR